MVKIMSKYILISLTSLITFILATIIYDPLIATVITLLIETIQIIVKDNSNYIFTKNLLIINILAMILVNIAENAVKAIPYSIQVWVIILLLSIVLPIISNIFKRIKSPNRV